MIVISSLLVLGMAALWLFLFRWNPNDSSPFYTSHPMWFAHRGLLHAAPENTLSSYRAAVNRGLPALELDVVCARDGSILCSHNYDLERETNGFGYVFEHDRASLQKVNAAHKWPGQKEEIPTLDSVLDQIPPTLRVNIELKTRKIFDFKIALKTATIVREKDLGNRVILSSFNPLSMAVVKLFHPSLLTGFIFETQPHFCLVWIARPDCLHPRADLITDELIHFARKRKLPINTWTVNTRPAMAWLLDRGIDGIITDRPEFRDELQSRATDRV